MELGDRLEDLGFLRGERWQSEGRAFAWTVVKPNPDQALNEPMRMYRT